jgi:hypothetical protein
MNLLKRKIPLFVLALIVGLMATSTVFGSATIVIENVDPAGSGFNDPTPAAPVGGNNGTTVGQQRLNAFQFAANIWGATLTSGPTITIRASWASLSCTATSGVLGSAGNSGSIWANFSGSVPNTWYGNALRNALTNSDASCSTAEINAQFNSNLGNPGCLQSLHWYYGFDGNEGGSGVDLVAVLLHEFAHGLGFQTFTSSSSGAQAGSAPNGPYPSIYDRFLLDNSTGKTWVQMTNAERAASAINTNNLVWNGPQVMSDAATVLSSGKDPAGHPQMYAPNPVQAGSSVSHWNTTASPNQLMEPNINGDLTHSVMPPQDLTLSLLRDIGWCSGCPDSTPSPCPPPPPTPPNNDFLNSQIISGCSGSALGTNLGANKESGEPSHSPDGNLGGASVWYRWQAPGSGNVTMTTAGSNFDTLLGIYTGNSVGALTLIGRNDDVGTPGVLTSSVTFTATAGTVYKIAVDGFGGSVGNITLNWTASSCPPNTINSVLPQAGRTSGGQQVKLFGPFANVSSVMVGGVSAAWSYTNGTSEITLTTPPHSVGAVNIDIVPTVGSTYTKSNGFAYLATVFTDDTLVVGVTTAKAQHIIELRQAVDALRLVAGLSPASWTDTVLVPTGSIITAVHIQELRTFLDNAATLLGYATQPYTDPSLTGGFTIKTVHIEELRQRIRNIAG